MALNSKLHVPYKDLSRFLEHLPIGMDFDTLQSKLSSLRGLSKKELTELLDYTRERNRIKVTPVTKNGENLSPYLRHRMYTDPGFVEEETVAPVPEEPKVVETPPEVPAEENPNTNDCSPIDLSALRRAHLGGSPEFITAAEGILSYLLKYPAGKTRTDMNNGVVGYNALRGSERKVVINYLKNYEGVIEKVQEQSGPGKVAGILIHPKYAERGNADFYVELKAKVVSFLKKNDGVAKKEDVLANVSGLEKLDLDQEKSIFNRMMAEGAFLLKQSTGMYGVPLTAYFVLPSAIDEVVTEPEPTTPSATAEEATPAAANPPTTLSLRAAIAQLEKAAEELEKKEEEKSLLHAITPVYDRIVKEFGRAQEALEKQIDAHAELGAAIAKLTKLINEEK